MSKIENIEFNQALSERYLSYALSTITARSLPDVRDGLKPVHRRLLYAMLQLNLSPQSAYKKCARIVGDVIGKYHPHGDGAVYDTLVRLAQSFSLRYPLIDGQGNFGSIDGDNAAAMRYTESKMTPIGIFLVSDIEKDTVDFRPTYDDSDSEPTLLPAMFPNLLANGSEGIAVGMATCILPHNLHELCDALSHLVDNPKSTLEEILQYIKGPDFPTGGILVEQLENIHLAYKTGKGSFRLRSRWHEEVKNKKSKYIIITEIPFQIQKAKIIEQIANLLKDKKLPLVTDIRDESAEDIRIVVEPKADCPLDIVMESLFKFTDLECKVHLNMNVICADNIPRILNLLQILEEFILHRKCIITRRSHFLLSKSLNRLEILKGLQIAYLNIDELIKIIRDEDHPKIIMMQKFAINDIQAESILNLKLRSLRKLDEYQIQEESKKLEEEVATLQDILANDRTMSQIIKGEIKEIQDKFGIHTVIGKRRTDFATPSNSVIKVDFSSLIEKEPLTIICSQMGWIKAVKGHSIAQENVKYKEGDSASLFLEVFSTDKIIICSSEGKIFNLFAGAINKNSGESLRLAIDINDHDIVNMFIYKPNQKILLASDNGKGFLTYADDLLAQTKTGKKVLNSVNSKCVVCTVAEGDMVATIGTSRKLLIFSLSEIPIMKSGQGVILQKFKDGKLTDIAVFNQSDGLKWQNNNKNRLETNLVSWISKRGNQGKLPPVGFPKNNKFNI